MSNSVNCMKHNPLKILLMVHIRPQRHVSNKQIFADGHPTVSNVKLGAGTQIPGQFSGTNQNSHRDSLFPLISCFYYFPDTIYPFHPAPHPSLLYWSAAKPWISFNHGTALLLQDSSFHQLPNTKRPRIGSGPRLSASHKTFRIIHLLPRLANKHTSDVWYQNATAKK